MKAELTVRPTHEGDLDRVMEVLDAARRFMRAHGNSDQWSGGYPQRSVIEADMRAGNSYVVEKDGRVCGTFSLIAGDDPTYSHIEGSWLNDRPYGTIHRIGSDGSAKGVADAALAFSRRLTRDIRIDTHADNLPMKRWIESRGFALCGTIYLADGSPRTAYQLTEE